MEVPVAGIVEVLDMPEKARIQVARAAGYADQKGIDYIVVRSSGSTYTACPSDWILPVEWLPVVRVSPMVDGARRVVRLSAECKT